MALETRLTKQGGAAGTIYYSCDVCGDVYPASQILRYRGRDYGIPCGDARDVQSLIERRYRDDRGSGDRSRSRR